MAITVGNMLGGTEHTWDILPRIETNKSGLTYPEGHLRDFDLKPFCQFSSIVLDKVHQSSAFRVLWEVLTCRGDRKAADGHFLPTGPPQWRWV